MKRVVLDTNILAAGLRSNRGASFALLREVAERRIRPLVSISLFLEYEAVLTRDEQMAAHGFSGGDIDQLLAEFAALAEPIDVHFLWRPLLKDPSDEMVLEVAVNGRAEALITHNIKEFSNAKMFEVKVMTPGWFLESIRS